jgi:hypothetical protein
LVSFHRGDRDYAFLNSGRIEDFDELNELFFRVLATGSTTAANSPSLDGRGQGGG